MFPEDVNCNILSFLGISPRRRCWAITHDNKICKKSVKNTRANLFCSLHDSIRFNMPLFKPYEEITYLANLTNAGKRTKKNPTILHCPSHTPTISDWVANYPNFPYV